MAISHQRVLQLKPQLTCQLGSPYLLQQKAMLSLRNNYYTFFKTAQLIVESMPMTPYILVFNFILPLYQSTKMKFQFWQFYVNNIFNVQFQQGKPLSGEILDALESKHSFVYFLLYYNMNNCKRKLVGKHFNNCFTPLPHLRNTSCLG